MTRKRDFNLLDLLAVLGVVAAVIFWIGGIPESLTALLFGWATYPVQVLPRVRVAWDRLASSAVYLVAFTLGFHLFSRWLYREWGFRRDALPPAGTAVPRRWRVRWTLAGVAIVALMFAAGTAAVGVVHQVGFLLTSDQPAYVWRDYWANADGRGLLSGCSQAWEELPMQDWRQSRWAQERYMDAGGMPSESVREIIVDGPDGRPAAVAVLHRDPALQQRFGVAVANAAGTRMVRPEALSAILQAARTGRSEPAPSRPPDTRPLP